MRMMKLTTTVLAATGLAFLIGPVGAATQRDEKVYSAVEAHRDGALDLLKSIVNIDSGSGDIGGGEQVESILTPRLQAAGAEVRTEPAEVPTVAPNLVAVFHGSGKARVLIIAHIDTVFGPGTVAGRPFSIDQERAHVEARAQALVIRARAAGARATFLVWEGDPAETILSASESERADAIVLGSHGRGALGRRLVGSISARVSDGARCSVLVGPREAAATTH